MERCVASGEVAVGKSACLFEERSAIALGDVEAALRLLVRGVLLEDLAVGVDRLTGAAELVVGLPEHHLEAGLARRQLDRLFEGSGSGAVVALFEGALA